MSRLGMTLALTVVAWGGVGLSEETYIPGEPVLGDFPTIAEGFLEKHCFDCHKHPLMRPTSNCPNPKHNF